MAAKGKGPTVQDIRELLAGADAVKTTSHDLTVAEKQILLGYIIQGSTTEEAAARISRTVPEVRAYLRSTEAVRAISSSLSGHAVRLPLLALQFFEEVLEPGANYPLTLKAQIATKVFDRLSAHLLPGATPDVGRDPSDMTIEEIEAIKNQLETAVGALMEQRAKGAKPI